MQQIVTPDNQSRSLFPKLFVMGFLILISWILTLFILAIVEDRSNRADEAAAEIATKWSRAQTLQGPVVTIPVTDTSITANGETSLVERLIFLLPDTLDYEVNLDTEVLSRGIFESRVYNSIVTGSGTFNLNQIDQETIKGNIQWDKARVSIGIPDTRGIDSDPILNWNSEQHRFEPGVASVVLGEAGIQAPIALKPAQNSHEFSFELALRGSESINFVPVGQSTTVSITSNWPAPSFSGEFLPKERKLTENGFTAAWSVASFGRSLEQSWIGSKAIHNQTFSHNLLSATFGVKLIADVDFYTQINRSIKYSILFITLTFLTFFMFEVMAKLRIHPMNYLLVGLAIALFYLLLLSFAENVGFLNAYVISTIAITGLITLYCKSVLQAKRRAAIISLLLIALYTYLYILLQLDELSLIFGSLFLFGVLSTVMYLTRNINWYELSDRS